MARSARAKAKKPARPASALIRAADLNLFDVAMWFHRGG